MQCISVPISVWLSITCSDMHPRITHKWVNTLMNFLRYASYYRYRLEFICRHVRHLSRGFFCSRGGSPSSGHCHCQLLTSQQNGMECGVRLLWECHAAEVTGKVETRDCLLCLLFVTKEQGVSENHTALVFCCLLLARSSYYGDSSYHNNSGLHKCPRRWLPNYPDDKHKRCVKNLNRHTLNRWRWGTLGF